MRPVSVLVRIIAAGCIALAAGCVPGVNAPAPTYTPDATLAAIAVMLTETSAAPTITPTPYWTPTPTFTPSPTPPIPGSSLLPGKVGEQMQAGGELLTVLSTSTPEMIGNTKPKGGMAFLDMEVLIANDSQQPQPYNRMYFMLVKDEQEMESLSAAVWPYLLSGELRPGEWVRGHVSFSVPAEALPIEQSGLRLRYTPQDPQNMVWIDLEQQAAQNAPVPATGDVNSMEPLPRPGDTVEAAGIALTIRETQVSQRVERAKAGDGHTFVSLLVTIANTNRDISPFNVEYFEARDPSGYEYMPTVMPSEAQIQAGSLRRGQSVTGQIVFEVPQDTTKLMIKYLPQVITGDYQEIRVEVEVGTP